MVLHTVDDSNILKQRLTSSGICIQAIVQLPALAFNDFKTSTDELSGHVAHAQNVVRDTFQSR